MVRQIVYGEIMLTTHPPGAEVYMNTWRSGEPAPSAPPTSRW